MKKLFVILIVCFLVSGCSLIPRLTFDSKGTTPQSINKSEIKNICKGQVILNDDGEIVSCSKGYKSSTQNYIKKERKYTLKEKIINFLEI